MFGRVSRGGIDRKRAPLGPPSGSVLLYLILPAIFATSLAVLLERDQTLAAHRERRIQERLLVELRKSGLETVQRETRSPLFQHVRDRSLNRCGAAHRASSGAPGPSGGCLRRTTPGAEPAVLNGSNGTMELALDLLDLAASTFQSAADQSLR